MADLEFKIGDKLITTDSFANKLGCNSFEIIDIIEIGSLPFNSINMKFYNVKIKGVIRIFGSIYGDNYKEERVIEVSSDKINPRPMINDEEFSSLNGSKAISFFFTSEEKKLNWLNDCKKLKRQNYLELAKHYGYNENLDIKKIVFEIIDSLCDRNGFDDWWYNLGDDIEQEIKDELFNIIKKRIN